MSKIADLNPTDGRKSFYGKAYVARRMDGRLVLVSYGTEVAEYADGKVRRLWAGKSATTTRHIAAFLDYVGSDMTTREYNAMQAA